MVILFVAFIEVVEYILLLFIHYRLDRLADATETQKYSSFYLYSLLNIVFLRLSLLFIFLYLLYLLFDRLAHRGSLSD